MTDLQKIEQIINANSLEDIVRHNLVLHLSPDIQELLDKAYDTIPEIERLEKDIEELEEENQELQEKLNKFDDWEIHYKDLDDDIEAIKRKVADGEYLDEMNREDNLYEDIIYLIDRVVQASLD